MYKNVDTGEIRTDEEFMAHEYRELLFDMVNNDTLFQEWINDNYTAFDIIYMKPEDQEKLYGETWAESCRESLDVWLKNSAYNDFYLVETRGWKKILDNSPEV